MMERESSSSGEGAMMKQERRRSSRGFLGGLDLDGDVCWYR